MILPSGKRRNQVAQGLSQHETIINNDVFASIKEAIALPDEVGPNDAATPPVSNDLQSTMNDSNSARLQSREPSDQQGDFAIMANEFSNFIANSGKLSGTYEIISQALDPKSGRVTLVIAPKEQPNLEKVTKDGEPLTRI